MAKQYPLISGNRRKPNPKRDGQKNYGAPCVICGAGTIGEKWVQVSWFRGEDEIARVCAAHWKEPDNIIIQAWLTKEKAPPESEDKL